MERRVGAPDFRWRALRADRPIWLQLALRSALSALVLAATTAAVVAIRRIAPVRRLPRSLPCGFIPQFLRARHHERRVPERVPPVLRDHVFGQLDAGGAKRIGLIERHAADAADDVILGREVLAERRPLTAGFFHRQFTHYRLALVDCVPSA